MQRNISPMFVAGALLALGLLTWNMAATVANTSQLGGQTALVQRSGDRLRSLDSVLSLVAEAESGQRGFVITGRNEYLEPYEAARRALGGQLDELARLVGDDSAQRARLVDVRRDVDARLGEMARTVEMRRQRGFEATQEAIVGGGGVAEAKALRATVTAMADVERRHLDARTAEAASTYRNALWSGLASGAAALLAVLGFALLLRRHLRERARAEQAISAEAEKFRTTLASIGDAVIATDVEGRITGMNPMAESLARVTAAESLGRPLASVFRIVDETTRQPADSPAARVLRDGATASPAQDALLLRGDGSELHIDDRAAPITAADGRVVGCVLVFRDNSERRRNERALAAAQAQLRGIVMQMAIPTMVYAEDGEVVLVNEAWTGLSGHGPEQIPTLREWTSRAYGPHGDEILAALQRMFELSAVVNNGERSITTADGQTRIWHFFTAPLGRDSAGRRMLVSNAIDVTEQKGISRRLEESEARLRFALDAAGLGQWELNVDGSGGSRTPGHDRIFGYAEMLPRWTVEVFMQHVLPEDRAEVEHVIRATFAGADGDLSCRILRADGEVRHIWIRASPQRDAGGAVVRLLGIIGDRTREAAAVQALQDADKRKDEFLATLAHELRNPLAPLRNALAILQLAHGDPEALGKTRDVMVRQVEHLVRLIDDLLDVSRISLDKLMLRREATGLAAILAPTVESLRPAALRAGQTLTLSLPGDEVPLDADPARLAQVFANLIGNALKFTPAGGHIDVSARRDGQRAVVSVRDDGIGIAAEHLRSIFGMFSQVDASLDRSQGGLGIGLNLVRRLVDLHGGTIEVRSEGLHRGSEFLVSLPVASAAGPEVLPEESGDLGVTLRPLRILVVDDNADSADSLVMLLALEGHDAHVARDGPQALERAEALQPEAVLLDIGLPGLNGYEVCKRLRAQAWGEQMAIIALTGWGQDEDRRRSAGAGFDGHLVKPATLDDVSRALAKAIGELELAGTSLR